MTYSHNNTSLTFKQQSILHIPCHNIMSLHKLLIISLLNLAFCSNTCLSKTNALKGYLDEAYPTFFGFIEEEEGELAAGLANMIEHGRDGYTDEAGPPAPAPAAVNVEDYGATGDGVTDDTEAFRKAWHEACSAGASVLVVPENKNYVLKSIIFAGPCKSDLTLQVLGTIEASDNREDYKKDRRHWLRFDNMHNFIVEGGGTFDGRGEIWWENSCKINKTLPCTHAPTAITFYKCNNLRVRDLRIKDAQQMHINFQSCDSVEASHLWVTAPGNSPNTDGIHITDTQNIQIMSCVIRTGDDCISIVDGARNVEVTDITCGPGHGISIGSLGANHSEDHVMDVKVDRARLVGTTNGVRIKTWQGGKGNATNIIFQNIVMDNVTNPIIIDQNYCDQKGPCKEQHSAVQVQDVVYRNIKGTSASNVAIKFDCSKSFPCKGILLEDINLQREESGREESGRVKAMCKNVKFSIRGKVTPCCPTKEE